MSPLQEAATQRTPQTIQLTPLQTAHTITAPHAHAKALDKKGDDDPEGGEYEDIPIAESVLKILMAAGAAAAKASREG